MVAPLEINRALLGRECDHYQRRDGISAGEDDSTLVTELSGCVYQAPGVCLVAELRSTLGVRNL